MNIPSKQDWQTDYPDCLDYQSAYKSFFGISQTDAYKLFADNALHYQEELNYMPTKAFQYYLKPFNKYLLSEESKGDCDGASSYFNLLLWKTIEEPEVLQGGDTLALMLKVAKYISTRQEFYDADEDIYGDFLSKYKKILSQIENSKS